MEWVIAGYVALALIAVPIFRVNGRFGLDYAKEQLFIVLTGLMVIIAMFHGKLPVVSNPWMIAFFGFVFISLFWCDHQHLGRREVVRLMATLAFVGPTSMLPNDYLILACFLPAPVFAIYGSIQQIWRRDFIDRRYEDHFKKRTRFQTFWGNANYAGAYLAVNAFLGFWLTMNQSLWFAIPTTIVCIGLVLTQCRAAQLSTILGLVLIVPWLIPFAIVGGVIAFWKWPGCLESIGHRWLLTRSAFNIWKHYPIFGAGPQCFRHKHSRSLAELNMKDETILGTPQKPGRYQFTVGRKAHNDYIETLAEYGLIGIILAGGMLFTIMWSLRGDWILFSAAAVFLINSTMFLSFRDTALSLPFWMIVATTGNGTQMPVGLLPALLCSSIILYLLWIYAYKPFMANWVSDRGNQVKALQLQPYASEYLHRIAIDACNQKYNTLAFNCAEKALFHYDGEVTEYDMLHTFGQVASINGALQIAKASYEQAILINPRHKLSLKSLRELNLFMNKLGMKEQKEAA
jgi:hypothetical protein